MNQEIKDAATRLWQICTALRTCDVTDEFIEKVAIEVDKVAITLAATQGLDYGDFDFEETNNLFKPGDPRLKEWQDTSPL